MFSCKSHTSSAQHAGALPPQMRHSDRATARHTTSLSGPQRALTAQDESRAHGRRPTLVGQPRQNRQKDKAGSPTVARHNDAIRQRNARANVSLPRDSAPPAPPICNAKNPDVHPFFVARRMGPVSTRTTDRQVRQPLTATGPFPPRSGGNHNTPNVMSEAT